MSANTSRNSPSDKTMPARMPPQGEKDAISAPVSATTGGRRRLESQYEHRTLSERIKACTSKILRRSRPRKNMKKARKVGYPGVRSTIGFPAEFRKAPCFNRLSAGVKYVLESPRKTIISFGSIRD